MAKSKSSKIGSKQFFTIVVASVAALAVIFLTTSLTKQSTDSESHASGGNNVRVMVRYDSNGNNKYDDSDCYEGPVKIIFGSNIDISFPSASNDCTKIVTMDGPTNLGLKTPLPSKLAYIYTDGGDGPHTYTTGISGGNVAAIPTAKGNSLVIFGIEGKPTADRPNQPSNCKPSISYHGSTGASKSVEYRFSVNNNCKSQQTYRVWTSIDTNGTSGWTYKFANGDVNSSIKKVIAGGDSGQAAVTVSRANVKGLPRGNSKYSVTFKVATCDNANNCNDISDVNKDKMDTYTTTYTVEN